MNKRTFGYALFVVTVIVTLASLPFLVGKIDPIYLLLLMIAIGFLWPILRIYVRKTSQPKMEEEADTQRNHNSIRSPWKLPHFMIQLGRKEEVL